MTQHIAERKSLSNHIFKKIFDDEFLSSLYEKTSQQSKAATLLAEVLEKYINNEYTLSDVLKYGIEFDNYSRNSVNHKYYIQLIQSGIITVQEFIDAFSSLYDKQKELTIFYGNAQLFYEFQKYDLFEQEHYDYLFEKYLNTLDERDLNDVFLQNDVLFAAALQRDETYFAKFLKHLRENVELFVIQLFLSRENLFKNLVESGALTDQRTKELFDVLTHREVSFHNVFFKNIYLFEQLLKTQTTTFDQLVEYCCDKNDFRSFFELLSHKEIVQMVKDKLIPQNSLLKLFKDVCKFSNSYSETRHLSEIYKKNTELVEFLLENKLINFKELIQKSASSLSALLGNSEFVENMMQKGHIDDKDLYVVFNYLSFDEIGSRNISKNTNLLLYAFDKELLSISEVFEESAGLTYLLNNEQFFERIRELDESKGLQRLKDKILDHLQQTDFDGYFQISMLFKNAALSKYLIDHKIYVDQLIETTTQYCEDRRILFHENSGQILKYMFEISKNVTQNFEWLDALSQSARESKHLLKELAPTSQTFSNYVRKALEDPELNEEFKIDVLSDLTFEIEAYEHLHTFKHLSHDEKLQLYKILLNNNSQNKCYEIRQSNLEDTYTFEQLKLYFSKKEKRNLLNL